MKAISFIMCAIGGFCLAISGARADIYVTNDYPTIQAAINAASPGAIIHLSPGKYGEALTINKSLTLIGSGVTNCAIYSNQTNNTPIISINGPANVTLSGFELNGGAYQSFNNWYNGFSPYGIVADGASLVLNSLVINQIQNFFVTVTNGTLLATNVSLWTVEIGMQCDVGFELDNCVAVFNGLQQNAGCIDHTININMYAHIFSDVTVLNSSIRASKLTWGNCLRTYADSRVVVCIAGAMLMKTPFHWQIRCRTMQWASMAIPTRLSWRATASPIFLGRSIATVPLVAIRC